MVVRVLPFPTKARSHGWARVAFPTKARSHGWARIAFPTKTRSHGWARIAFPTKALRPVIEDEPYASLDAKQARAEA